MELKAGDIYEGQKFELCGNHLYRQLDIHIHHWEVEVVRKLPSSTGWVVLYLKQLDPGANGHVFELLIQADTDLSTCPDLPEYVVE